jgi:hypothetical protein
MANINLKRALTTTEATIGILDTDWEDSFVILEDTYRENKIGGETRIPDGEYEIKFRKVLSNKTKAYRAKYSWFKWHLELQGVDNFQYVYIHIGNTKKDTDGCLLIGRTYDSYTKNKIYNSMLAFRKFYKAVSKKLNNNEKIYIKITS